jgi:hypothetical protein
MIEELNARSVYRNRIDQEQYREDLLKIKGLNQNINSLMNMQQNSEFVEWYSQIVPHIVLKFQP